MQLVPGLYSEKLRSRDRHLLLGFMLVIPVDATRRGWAKLSLGSGNQDNILGLFLVFLHFGDEGTSKEQVGETMWLFQLVLDKGL